MGPRSWNRRREHCFPEHSPLTLGKKAAEVNQWDKTGREKLTAFNTRTPQILENVLETTPSCQEGKMV